MINKKREQGKKKSWFYYIEGQVQEKQKKYDLALTLYSKAIAEDQKVLGYRLCRAKVYIYGFENYAKALEDVNYALERDSESVEAYRLRGVIYRTQKKYEEALKDYDKLLKMNPNQDSFYVEKAEVYIAMENFSMAEKLYNTAIELAPNRKDYYWKRANLYQKWGKVQKALHDLNVFQKDKRDNYER